MLPLPSPLASLLLPPAALPALRLASEVAPPDDASRLKKDRRVFGMVLFILILSESNSKNFLGGVILTFNFALRHW